MFIAQPEIYSFSAYSKNLILSWILSKPLFTKCYSNQRYVNQLYMPTYRGGLFQEVFNFVSIHFFFEVVSAVAITFLRGFVHMAEVDGVHTISSLVGQFPVGNRRCLCRTSWALTSGEIYRSLWPACQTGKCFRSRCRPIAAAAGVIDCWCELLGLGAKRTLNASWETKLWVLLWRSPVVAVGLRPPVPYTVQGGIMQGSVDKEVLLSTHRDESQECVNASKLCVSRRRKKRGGISSCFFLLL